MSTPFLNDPNTLTETLNTIDEEHGTNLRLLDDNTKERILNRYTTDMLPDWLDAHGFDSTVYATNANHMDWWLISRGYDETQLIAETVQELADEGNKPVLARLSGKDLLES